MLVIGEFGNSVTFNNGATLTSYGGLNTYLAKFDDSMNCKWVSQIGSAHSTSHMKGLDSDFENNIIISGNFNDTVQVGNLSVFGNTAAVDFCLLYAKYDSSGNAVWAKGICSDEPVMNEDLSTDVTGAVFVGGRIQDTVFFDAIQVSGYSFLAKMDSSGNFSWVKSYSDPRVNLLQCRIVSGGRVLGYYWIDGSGQAAVYMDSFMVAGPWGQERNAIAVYDSSAQINWIDTIGSFSWSCCLNRSLDLDGLNNIYVCGSFIITLNVQECQINPTNIGDYNIFLAKISDLATNQDQIENDASVITWPVPFHDLLNVHFSNDPKTFTEIGLFNSFGQNVYCKQFPIQDEILNVSFLPHGVYILVIKSIQGNITKMIVK
jgi:hypothetical protein